MESREIDLIRFRKIVDSLNPRIEEKAIKISVLARYALDELVQIRGIIDIIREAICLASAVLANESVDPVLPSAHGDEFRSVAKELFRHAEANA